MTGMDYDGVDCIIVTDDEMNGRKFRLVGRGSVETSERLAPNPSYSPHDTPLNVSQ